VCVIAAQKGATPPNSRITEVTVVYAIPNIPAPPAKQLALQTRGGYVFLLDVLTVNGSIYYLTSHEGSYPPAIAEAQVIGIQVVSLGGGSSQIIVTLKGRNPFSISDGVEFQDMADATFLEGVKMTVSATSIDQIVGTIAVALSNYGPAAEDGIVGNDGDVSYKPRIVSAGPFTLTRTLQTDGGPIVLENISGNTIQRNVMNAIANDELEGALAIFRVYDFILGSIFELHGKLSHQPHDESIAQFNIGQLLDPSAQNLPLRVSSDLCTWIYKSDVCGSTGTATSCPKTQQACKSAARDAFPRFNGSGSPPSLLELSSIQFQSPKPTLVRVSRKANI
jgi:hypothetical protein